jgi:hypothetical protein
MKLESSDIYLRDNLSNIMNGEWDSQFNEEQLEMAKKTSFLFNHITIEERCVIFEYGDKKVKYNFNSDPLDYQMHIGDFSTHMISMIINSEDFLSSYKVFIRDWKINKIIE